MERSLVSLRWLWIHALEWLCVRLHECVISPVTFNSASAPSASLCLFYNHHFYLSIHFVCVAHHSHPFFMPLLHWQPSSLTLPPQACVSHQNNNNNNNRWVKSWASSLFIINAFAVFLTVKGEAPAPPLSHDHLPPSPRSLLGGLQEGHHGSAFAFLGWHASTLTTLPSNSHSSSILPRSGHHGSQVFPAYTS